MFVLCCVLDMRDDNQRAVLLLGPIAHGEIFLPIAGACICAGSPPRPDDSLDGEIDLARILTPNRAATFLWRVTGHSMKETGIHDGDVVVVDRSRKPRHSDVVVASINGEISLKRFKNDGRPTISFANRDMPVFPDRHRRRRGVGRGHLYTRISHDRVSTQACSGPLGRVTSGPSCREPSLVPGTRGGGCAPFPAPQLRLCPVLTQKWRRPAPQDEERCGMKGSRTGPRHACRSFGDQ
jgi:DNA polymerase V